MACGADAAAGHNGRIFLGLGSAHHAAHGTRLGLPTRLFHWAIVATTIALVVTAKVGGNAMPWHMRLGLGLLMLALLAFRLAWGLVGGHWSRFANFLYSPGHLSGYLAGRGDETRDDVGHSPLGALSVFTLLAQVCSRLRSDDQIASAGSLAHLAPGEWVDLASWYHKDVGQYLLVAFVVLHLCAIAFYTLVRRRPLVRAMVRGDKQLPRPAPSARDDLASRIGAAAILAAACVLAWWVAGLG